MLQEEEGVTRGGGVSYKRRRRMELRDRSDAP